MLIFDLIFGLKSSLGLGSLENTLFSKIPPFPNQK